MNPQSGLKIRPFRNAHQNREHDRELLQLAAYLKSIAHLDDFTQLNHKHWERYGSSHKSKKRRSKEDPVLWTKMNLYVWSDGGLTMVACCVCQIPKVAVKKLKYRCLF